MGELDAPAKLVYWPDFADDGAGDGDAPYPTLRQALALAVDSEPGRVPWIVREDGKILSPREIEALWSEINRR